MTEWYLIRIIAGNFKGTRLKIPGDYDIRPTQDRVKESIFNVLGNSILHARVLDLFAGSGSLGLESLSRGAESVCFVDSSFKAIKLIKSNINILKDPFLEYNIFNSDALKFLKKYTGLKFSIIFIDPPYKINTEIMNNIFNLLSDNKLIKKDGIIVYEYFFKRDVAEEIKMLKQIKNSHFGDKIVTYLAVWKNISYYFYMFYIFRRIL